MREGLPNDRVVLRLRGDSRSFDLLLPRNSFCHGSFVVNGFLGVRTQHHASTEDSRHLICIPASADFSKSQCAPYHAARLSPSSPSAPAR